MLIFIARKNSLITHRIYNAPPPTHMRTIRWYRGCTLYTLCTLYTVQSCVVPAMRGWPEAEFLDEIQTQVLRVFLLAIHSHLCSFALRFIFLQTRTNSYGFLQLLYTEKEKGGKADRKPHPLPYGLRNSFKFCELSRLCPEISTKL